MLCGCEQAVHGDLVLLNLFIEKEVILGEVGGPVIVSRIAPQPLIGVLVSLHGLEFHFFDLGVDLVHQIGLGNSVIEQAVLRFDLALSRQVRHGQEQKRNGGDALLAVDQQQLKAVAHGVADGDDAAEEVPGLILPDHLYKVAVELLTVFRFPVVVALIYWHHQLAGAFQILGQGLGLSVHAIRSHLSVLGTFYNTAAEKASLGRGDYAFHLITCPSI